MTTKAIIEANRSPSAAVERAGVLILGLGLVLGVAGTFEVEPVIWTGSGPS